MTFAEAAKAVQQAKAEALAELEFAEHKTLDFAADVLHRRSSGTATERMLSTPVARGGFGHPYGYGPIGAAGPRGPIPNGGDAGVINIQTGEFAAGWQQQPGYFQGDAMTNQVVNNTQHAQFLDATPTNLQIRRPIVERAEAEVLPVRMSNLQQALDRINQI